MKFFVCVLMVAAVASADKEARDKRGIFGEPGGLLTPHLHHDALLAARLHAPLHAAPLLHSAPLLHPAPIVHSAPILHSAPIVHSTAIAAPLLDSHHLHHDLLHHAPLAAPHIHAPLVAPHLHAPLVAPHLHAPLVAPHLHAPLIPDLHHAPLLAAPTVIRVTKTLHAAPLRHGWK